MNVQIVTDSCAHVITPHFWEQHTVTVVPNRITIAGKPYRETVDLSAEEALRLLSNEPYAPLVTSPTTADYLEVYTRLSRSCDAIISIHASREVYSSWQNAMTAARQLAGHCQIAVIDSRSLDAAQGMLIKAAIRAIRDHEQFDDMVKAVRGAVERLYAVYYVESVGFLQQNKILSSSHTILGAMLGIKPLLGLEDGRPGTIEKVKTRGQAIDRLVEFIAEFAHFEDVLILQNRGHITETTRSIQDRLATDFPNQHFPYGVYGASMAALIGTEASGVVILEQELEMDEIEDDEDTFRDG
jgi:DegV family protein with EDD domain